MPTSPEAAPGFRWAPGFILAFVALLPFRGLAETVLSLGSLLAMGLLLRQRFQGGTSLLSREAWALTTALFFAYWLPELFSAPDALNGAKTWKSVATDLRYLPFLWLVAMAMASARGRRIVGAGLGVIVLAWSVDALVEAATGVGLHAVVEWVQVQFAAMVGKPPPLPPAPADRLAGIFGAGNLKLGLIICSLAPFALETLRVRFGAAGWLVGAVLVGVVVLLAGARAAWLSYALVLAFSGWRALRSKTQIAAVLGLGLVAAIAGWYLSPQLRARLERSVEVASTAQGAADVASSGRMSLWRTAGAMAMAHPVNGVGVRSFRDAYATHAAPDDFFVRKGEIALHAHQLVLEVLTETGLVGVLLWLMGAVLAWRAWSWAPPAARDGARAGRHRVPVEHAPRVLFELLGRRVPAAARTLRRQPACGRRR
jgi:O-antigen ligase